MPRFYTLGPAGSCHAYALGEYLRFQNVRDAETIYVDDLLAGASEAASTDDCYLLQCSAHLEVHEVTERFRHTLPVVDTFILPTQPLALVKRRGVSKPRSIGLPKAALGYITAADWEEIVFETTKPVVAAKLLAGSYDAGLTYVRTAVENPDIVEVVQEIGEVVTTWILYGPKPRYRGQIIAAPYPALHHIQPSAIA